MKKEKQILWLKALSLGLYRVIPETGMLERWNGSSWLRMIISPLPSGYVQYQIICEGKSIYIYGHVAVWLAVNGEYESGLIVNHNDFNRSNNAISNLKLSTQKENIEYSRLAKRYPSKNPLRRFKQGEIARIREMLTDGKTQVEIAKRLEAKRISVAYVCRQINAGKKLRGE